MSADDRALLEVATVIRAASGTARARRRASSARSSRMRCARRSVAAARRTSGVGHADLAGARKRWVPWAIAGASTLVAAAAVLLLWLRAPEHAASPRRHGRRKIPTSWTSRPADPLIGPIAREHAGDASSRIDTIFADRLDGYRERTAVARGRQAMKLTWSWHRGAIAVIAIADRGHRRACSTRARAPAPRRRRDSPSRRTSSTRT